MSETHGYLINGWKFAKNAVHGKNALHTSDDGYCIYGAYLAGNGVELSECRKFYPPFTGELAKYNAGAKMLQSVVPGGNIPGFNDVGWTDRSHMVAVFRLAIKKLEEIEGISPSILAFEEEKEAVRQAKIDEAYQELAQKRPDLNIDPEIAELLSGNPWNKL